MRLHEFIEHTADVRMHVEGSTQEDLFIAALEGMAALMVPESVGAPAEQSALITLTSVDITALLVDFLNEVLAQSQTHYVVYTRVHFTRLSPTSLEATVHGHSVSSFDEDIKAVTYHEADVHTNAAGNLETMIVFDI